MIIAELEEIKLTLQEPSRLKGVEPTGRGEEEEGWVLQSLTILDGNTYVFPIRLPEPEGDP